MPDSRRDGKFAPEVERKALQILNLGEFTKKLIKDVRQDDQSRASWAVQEAFFIRRRYGMEFRDVDFPWPGASDIVIPTIDAEIEKLKPDITQSTLGVFPRVTIQGQDRESIQRERELEFLMSHITDVRMPNFAEEVACGNDLYHQHGHVTFKVDYAYRTRRVREVITRDRLPVSIRAFVTSNAVTPEVANLISSLQGPSVLTPEDLKTPQVQQALRGEIAKHYGLQESDPDDKKAIGDIVKFVGSGDDSVTITKRQVVQDTPRMKAVAPQDLIVAKSVVDIQDATRITHRMRMPISEIEEMGRDKKWPKAAVDIVIGKRKKPRQQMLVSDIITRSRDLVDQRSLQRGFVGTGEIDDLDTREIWEVYTWRDIDNDGKLEKVVITIDPVTGTLLRIIELPFNHGKWPFVQIRFEYTGNREFYGSRGVPQILDDLDAHITNQHRDKQNANTITNAPVLLYRMGQHINPSNLRFVPGQMFPVTSIDDIAALNLPNRDISFEREEGILRNFVQERTGNLVSQGQTGRLTRPRTAQEIRSVGAEEAAIQGARILLWHEGMTKVYDMIFDLWIQYGPDEVTFRVTQTDDPIRLTKHELQGNFLFRPTPSALTPPAVQAQKVQGMIQDVIQVVTATGGQIGDRYEFDVGEMLAALIEYRDPRLQKRIMRRRSDEEVQQIQEQRQAQQEAQVNPQVEGSGEVGQVADRIAKVAAAAQNGQVNNVGEVV